MKSRKYYLAMVILLLAGGSTFIATSFGRSEKMPLRDLDVQFTSVKDSYLLGEMVYLDFIIKNKSNRDIIHQGLDMESHYLTVYIAFADCKYKKYSRPRVTDGMGIFKAGDTMDFTVMELDVDCFGNFLSPFPVESGVFFSSSNTGVATIDASSGLATGISPGDAIMSVDFTGIVFINCGTEAGNDEYCCEASEVPAHAEASCEIRPRVTITPFDAVGKGETFPVTVQVVGNSNNTPITLRLRRLSGTGESLFSNNSSTIVITKNADVAIKGITESNAKDNYIIETIINGQVQASSLSKDKFSILWVTLTIRNRDVVSSDNAARQNQIDDIGTDALGTIFSTGTMTVKAWRTCVEIVGTVTPSDFTETISLPRSIATSRAYLDMTLVPSLNLDNKSDPQNSRFVDFDPSPNGKIYDIDCPALFSTPNAPEGVILRVRTNFTQFAQFQNKRVSGDLNWFSRLSIIKTQTGDVLRTQSDIINDNRSGTPSTPVTWNLVQ